MLAEGTVFKSTPINQHSLQLFEAHSEAITCPRSIKAFLGVTFSLHHICTTIIHFYPSSSKLTFTLTPELPWNPAPSVLFYIGGAHFTATQQILAIWNLGESWIMRTRLGSRSELSQRVYQNNLDLKLMNNVIRYHILTNSTTKTNKKMIAWKKCWGALSHSHWTS